MIHAILIFSVKFILEFTSLAMNFSIEESKENDLIIKAATGNIKTRTIRNLLFSLALQAVRINNQGALLLGLAKSIYYFYPAVANIVTTAELLSRMLEQICLLKSMCNGVE